MQKLSLFLLLLISMAVSATAQKPLTLIELTQEETDTVPDGRSVIVEPAAYVGGQCVAISYPMSTVSQVIILNAATQAVVYSAPYDATRQVVVNLSSLPEGLYELHLYAFDKWWWGEFELDEDKIIN